ncbi:MAG: FAD-dependent oxidoreductase [Bacillota bacterium]|nr:FAD-dependent oxidoreductase [Bacillota bacterium]
MAVIGRLEEAGEHSARGEVVMKTYRYVIVGGGMTADAAVDGIREVDEEGSIGLFSEERFPPYNRPPLSKGLWKGERLEQSWRKVKAPAGVEEHLGVRIVALDPAERKVIDADGNAWGYEKCFLAVGGRPKRLAFGEEAARAGDLIYFRTLEDYLQLRWKAALEGEFVVVGGGFIGAEVAAALAMQGKRVSMIFPEATILERLFPPELGQAVNRAYEERGVRLLTGDVPVEIVRQGELLEVRSRKGERLRAGAVVAGLGIAPGEELARGAGLAVEDGILVDRFLRTSRPDVFAGGDCARFPAPALGEGRTLRVEHEENANAQGRLAGRNMALAATGRAPGAAREDGEGLEPYDYLPFFYSDMFELGYEAVGVLDSRLQTFADWKEPLREGVVYYLDQGRVVGVLDWNVWDAIPQARALIEEGATYPDPSRLKGRIGA